jgi:ribosomal protein S18 acetylase RimI-like enzyme
MVVRPATSADYAAWIELAREVEDLFGPMAAEPSFQQGLRAAIRHNTAFCVDSPGRADNKSLDGGIVIEPQANEIVWLAVAKQRRRRGLGEALLRYAIAQLDRSRDIEVQTFDQTVPAGAAARVLYRRLGFIDARPAGANPAGIATVIMRLPALER